MNFLTSAIFSSLSEFWDILTGVIDDNRSKIIRLTIFVTLSLGIMWAVLNYFRADRISDTQRDLGYASDYVFTPRENNEQSLTQMADVAQKLAELRDGGQAIAGKIAVIHKKPFNIDGYNEAGLESLASTTEETPQEQAPQGPQRPQITLKAIMNLNKRKVALIDTARRSGLMIKQGDRLPGNSGRVVKIKDNKITVRFESQNFEYNVEGGTATTKIRGVY